MPRQILLVVNLFVQLFTRATTSYSILLLHLLARLVGGLNLGPSILPLLPGLCQLGLLDLALLEPRGPAVGRYVRGRKIFGRGFYTFFRGRFN